MAGTSQSVVKTYQEILGPELTNQVIIEARAAMLCGYHKGKGACIVTESIKPIIKRSRLPETRIGISHKFKIDGVRCYLTVNLYPDGSPGEVFLKIDKVGSLGHGFADCWATLFSIALQYGIPLEKLIEKSKWVKFYPRGITDSKQAELRFADSIVDYVARWLEIKFKDNQKVITKGLKDDRMALQKFNNEETGIGN